MNINGNTSPSQDRDKMISYLDGILYGIRYKNEETYGRSPQMDSLNKIKELKMKKMTTKELQDELRKARGEIKRVKVDREQLMRSRNDAVERFSVSIKEAVEFKNRLKSAEERASELMHVVKLQNEIIIRLTEIKSC